jgi:hypothetical protein
MMRMNVKIFAIAIFSFLLSGQALAQDTLEGVSEEVRDQCAEYAVIDEVPPEEMDEFLEECIRLEMEGLDSYEGSNEEVDS